MFKKIKAFTVVADKVLFTCYTKHSILQALLEIYISPQPIHVSPKFSQNLSREAEFDKKEKSESHDADTENNTPYREKKGIKNDTKNSKNEELSMSLRYVM